MGTAGFRSPRNGLSASLQKYETALHAKIKPEVDSVANYGQIDE
jgi:hypothetical protein